MQTKITLTVYANEEPEYNP